VVGEVEKVAVFFVVLVVSGFLGVEGFSVEIGEGAVRLRLISHFNDYIILKKTNPL